MIQGCKPHCLFIVSNIWISIWFCPNRLGSFLWKRQIELKCLVVLFESLQKYGLKLEAKREPDMQPTITEEVQPEIPASQIVDPAPQPSDQDTTVVVTKDEFEQNQKGRVPLCLSVSIRLWDSGSLLLHRPDIHKEQVVWTSSESTLSHQHKGGASALLPDCAESSLGCGIQLHRSEQLSSDPGWVLLKVQRPRGYVCVSCIGDAGTKKCTI